MHSYSAPTQFDTIKIPPALETDPTRQQAQQSKPFYLHFWSHNLELLKVPLVKYVGRQGNQFVVRGTRAREGGFTQLAN